MTDAKMTEQQVVDWLREHPEFLAEQPDLLAALRIPHESGTASLIERQVDVLRADNQRLRRQLKQLSRVAGENEHLMKRLQTLSLELVSTASTGDLLDRLESGLADDFSADAVAIVAGKDVEGLPDGTIVRRAPSPSPEWLEALLDSGQPLCGRLTRDKREAVFGTVGADLGSAALVPISADVLLAIGARSDDRFHPDMGTLFLELLRETLRYRLERLGPSGGRQRARA